MKITEEQLKTHFPSLRPDGKDLRSTCPLCQTEALTFSPKFYLSYCFTCKKGGTWNEAIAIFCNRSEDN